MQLVANNSCDVSDIFTNCGSDSDSGSEDFQSDSSEDDKNDIQNL